MGNQKGAQFDDVFKHINSFGLYQHCVYWSLALLKFPMTFQFLFLVFAFGTQKVECISPNITCPENSCCQNCTMYSFDKTFVSAVSEWHLICDRAHFTAVKQSTFFWGMLFGSLTGGWIADKFGRKKCTFVNLFMVASFSLVSAFVPSAVYVSILRFCIGFTQISLMVSQYSLGMELVGPTKRTFAGIATTFMWKIAGGLSVLLAYAFPYWRHFVLGGSLFGFLFIPFYGFFPESPRWLLAQGRLDEALTILMKFGSSTSKPIDEQTLRELLEEVRNKQLEQERSRKTYHVTDLCRTPRIRRFSILMCFNWFVVALLFFAMYLFVTRLYGNIFINAVIMNVADIPSLCLAWILTARFGRRIIFSLFMFIGAISLLVLPFVHKEFPKLKTVLALSGKSLMGAEFTLVYMMTSELFPTVVRNISIGTASMVARFGAILAPFFVMMAQLPGVSLVLPFCLFGGLGILSSLLTLLLPETLFSNMEQTIDAAEKAPLDYSIPGCKKRKQNRHEEIWMVEKPILEEQDA